MKKITGILLLVAIFATMLSISAFAASASELTITTDKTSVATGETVVVTVEATGNFLDVASVSTSIAFDTDKFSIDTKTKDYNETVDDDFYVCFDADWIDSIMNDKKNSLGRLAAPMSAAGENPAGQLNVVFQKSSGLTATNSNLSKDGSVVTTVKAIFTAKADVANIDATCFSLVEGVCKIETASKELHTLTYNQLAANDPDPVPVAGTKEKAVTLEATEVTSGDFTYTNVAVFDGAYTLELAAGESVSKAGVMYEGESVKAWDIAAEDGASIEYKVLFYGISADDAAALGAKIQTYFEGMFLPEA